MLRSLSMKKRDDGVPYMFTITVHSMRYCSALPRHWGDKWYDGTECASIPDQITSAAIGIKLDKNQITTDPATVKDTVLEAIEWQEDLTVLCKLSKDADAAGKYQARKAKIMLMGSKDGKKMSKLGSASIDFSKYIEQTDFAGIDLKSLQEDCRTEVVDILSKDSHKKPLAALTITVEAVCAPDHLTPHLVKQGTTMFKGSELPPQRMHRRDSEGGQTADSEDSRGDSCASTPATGVSAAASPMLQFQGHAPQSEIEEQHHQGGCHTVRGGDLTGHRIPVFGTVREGDESPLANVGSGEGENSEGGSVGMIAKIMSNLSSPFLGPSKEVEASATGGGDLPRPRLQAGGSGIWPLAGGGGGGGGVCSIRRAHSDGETLVADEGSARAVSPVNIGEAATAAPGGGGVRFSVLQSMSFKTGISSMIGSAFKSASATTSPDINFIHANPPPEVPSDDPSSRSSADTYPSSSDAKWERVKQYGVTGADGVFEEIETLNARVATLEEELRAKDRAIAERDGELARLREEVASLKSGSAVGRGDDEDSERNRGENIGSRSKALAETEEHLTMAYGPILRSLEDEVDDLRARLSESEAQSQEGGKFFSRLSISRHKSQPLISPTKNIKHQRPSN